MSAARKIEDPRAANLAEIRRIAEELEARCEALVTELLPAARREGPHYRVGGLDGAPGQSLCITVAGDKRGLWFDFSTGERGDMLDLVGQVLYRGDREQALRWARVWLGITSETPAPVRPRPPAAKAEKPGETDKQRSRRAKALWFDADPDLRGTVAERYLASRGIILEQLGRQPRALRFAPALDHIDRETGEVTRWPALLAAISSPEGSFIAVHRTWLALDGGGKAPVANPKMTLGSYKGGAIRLWRGDSGEPLRLAKPGSSVIVTEGIEDGLTVAMASPELRVLVAVSLANMGAMLMPAAIARVVIMAQNDPPGSAAEAGLARAVANFQRQGKDVAIARVDRADGKDANDAWRKWRAESRTTEGAA